MGDRFIGFLLLVEIEAPVVAAAVPAEGPVGLLRPAQRPAGRGSSWARDPTASSASWPTPSTWRAPACWSTPSGRPPMPTSSPSGHQLMQGQAVPLGQGPEGVPFGDCVPAGLGPGGGGAGRPDGGVFRCPGGDAAGGGGARPPPAPEGGCWRSPAGGWPPGCWTMRPWGRTTSPPPRPTSSGTTSSPTAYRRPPADSDLSSWNWPE